MYIFSSAKNGIWIRKNSFFDFLYSLSPLIQIIFSLSDRIFYALSNEPKKKNVSPPRNGDNQKKPSQLSDWLKKKFFLAHIFRRRKTVLIIYTFLYQICMVWEISILGSGHPRHAIPTRVSILNFGQITELENFGTIR